MRRTAKWFGLVAGLALVLAAGLAPAGAGATETTPRQFDPSTVQAGGDSAAWRVVRSPNAGSGNNMLWGVTALSSSNAWAVGDFFDPGTGHPKTLTEHWDGAAWKIVPSPNADVEGGSTLQAIDAISPKDAWAVGKYTYGTLEGNMKTLIEHWDGSKWQLVPSPNAGVGEGGNGSLEGVFARTPKDAWAVGSYYPEVEFPTLQPLIERWDGRAWKVVPGPRRSPGPWSELRAVSGSGRSDIWAVGKRDVRVGNISTERALILHWDGQAWKRMRSPIPAGLHPFGLSDVVALSRKNAWAVGSVSTTTTQQTVVMHWDGRAWKLVPSVNPSQQFQSLSGVAAVSPRRVFAVGAYYDPQSGRIRTLVERWNGTRWTVASSGNRGAENHLMDVAAIGRGQFAVGGFGVDPQRTLILHREQRP